MQENLENVRHPVYDAPLYLCTHRGRPPWGGRARASFVECGLILMGTDDKQRKQASSLPGEICLLLAGVQRGPGYTRVAHRHETRRREPRRAIEGYRHSWLPLQPGRRRAPNSRKGRGRGARATRRTGTVQRSFTRIVYARALGYVSRHVDVMRVNQREKGRRRGWKRMIVCRYLERSRPDPRRGTHCGLRSAKLSAIDACPS